MSKKPLCDCCGEKEYHIAVLDEKGEEEFLCKECYEEYRLTLGEESELE